MEWEAYFRLKRKRSEEAQELAEKQQEARTAAREANHKGISGY